MGAASAKVINDSVLGRISLRGSIEERIISTPAFLRLGNLSQLGLGRMVFPGATHTRLSHSLGVMHLAGRIGDVLGLPRTEIRKLRLAALLHDIGQYPLSHCIELVYRMIAHEQTRSASYQHPIDVQDFPFLKQAGTGAVESGFEADDKHMGAFIIRQRADLRRAFGRNGAGLLDDVAAMVGGEDDNPLHQAILNSDYDCDRLDYVQRDSFTTGVPYGHIDLDFLIENMVKVDFAPPALPLLAVRRRKGMGALEHYLLARYYMYSQVAFHKTVRSFELLAKAIFLALAHEGGIVYEGHEEIQAKVSEDEFLSFDDSYFYSSIRKYLSKRRSNPEIKKLIRRLLRRERLQLAFESRSIQEPRGSRFVDPAQMVLNSPTTLRNIGKEAKMKPSEIVADFVPKVELVPLRADVDLGYEDIRRQATELLSQGRYAELTKLLTAPWVYEEGQDPSLLADEPGSILRLLRGRNLYLIRVYTTRRDKRSAKDLREKIEDEIGRGVGTQ